MAELDDGESSRASLLMAELERAEDKVRYLQRFLKADQSEDEVIDFKGAQQLDIKGQEVMGIWSKALSCFGNSGGGLLIWGIDNPQTGLRSLSLAQDAKALAERLLQLIPTATDPPLQRIDVRVVLHGSGPGGYVVCHIPKSRWGPHQAKHGKPLYYIRAGDNCQPASRDLLRQLFYPERVCRLQIGCRPGRLTMTGVPMIDEADALLHVPIWLHNIGEVTAYDVMVVVKWPEGLAGPTFERFWCDTHSSIAGKAVVASRPIHPGEHILIAAANIGHTFPSKLPVFVREDLRFEFGLFAKDQRFPRLVLVLRSRTLEMDHYVAAQPA